MTAAITNYATLTSGINDATEGGYAAGETDRFIGLAEADFRLYFGPNFAKETSATLAFVAGVATLPSGLVRPLSLRHSTYGELTERAMGEVRNRRTLALSTIPTMFAISGASVEVDSSYTGNLTFDYEGTLAGLTTLNTTNWLITYAPQVYLAMCVYYAKAFDEDPNAPSFLGAAMQRLNDLGIQSMVAQVARASVRIHGSTP